MINLSLEVAFSTYGSVFLEFFRTDPSEKKALNKKATV